MTGPTINVLIVYGDAGDRMQMQGALAKSGLPHILVEDMARDLT